MSKTPEELAEEYVNKHAWTGTGAIEKKCFLAGYKAGYGRGFCEAGNVEWKHVLEEAKKQDENT